MIDDCDGHDPDRAILACRALIASGTETQAGLSATHMMLGIAYIRKQRWAEAIPELDQAIALDTDGSHKFGLYLSRATAHNANCQLDAAIDDDNRAIALKPNDASPYFGRGLVWLRKGDVARARADFAQAHRMEPATYPTPEQAFASPRPPACPKAVAPRG